MKLTKILYLISSLIFLAACSDNRQAGPSTEVPVIGSADSTLLTFEHLNSAAKQKVNKVFVVEILKDSLKATEFSIPQGQNYFLLETPTANPYRFRVQSGDKVISHSKTLNASDSIQELELKPKTYVSHKIRFNENYPARLYNPNTTKATLVSSSDWIVELDVTDSVLFIYNDTLIEWDMTQEEFSLELNSKDSSIKVYNLGAIQSELCNDKAIGANELCDSRDGRAYRTVQIGSQTWLGEDLKFTKGLELDFDPVREPYEAYVHCVDNDSLNCVNETVLYDGALLSQNGDWQEFCPEGYRTTSLEDWNELMLSVGLDVNADSITAQGAFRVTNTEAGLVLMKKYLGNDKFNLGLTLPVPTGMTPSDLAVEGSYITSTLENPSKDSSLFMVLLNGNGMIHVDSRIVYVPQAIRCVKGSSQASLGVYRTASVCNSEGIYWDEMCDSRDKSVYQTIEIGTQTWTRQNMNFDPGDGQSYCYDNQDSNCVKYGRLYKWSSAVDVTNGACPSGWHLPSQDEWESLAQHVADENNAETSADQSSNDWSLVGKYLKNGDLALSSWSYNNTQGDMNFDALGAGRFSTSDFIEKGDYTYFWTSNSSASFGGYAEARFMYAKSDSFRTSEFPMQEAHSVRCIQD